MKKWTVLLLTIAFAGIIFWSCSDDGGGTTDPVNQAPTCVITSPAPSTGFNSGETIEVKVEAEDEDGDIKEVRFLLNGGGAASVQTFPYNAIIQTTGLLTGGHIITVIAIDNDGEKTEVELPFGIKPQAATDLQIAQNNVHTFTLNWTYDLVGVDGFKIERKIDAAEFLEVGTTTEKTYVDSTMAKSSYESVYYRVTAHKGIYHSDPVEKDFLISFPPPSNLTFTKVDINTIRLNWNDNSNGEDGFRIDKKIGLADWTDSYASVGENIRTWTDANAEINETIQYRVYAFKGSNSSNVVTSASINNSFPAPTGLTVAQNNVHTFTLNWTDNSIGEDGFKIERKIDEGEYSEIASVTGTSYVDDMVSKSYGTVYYRARAYKDEHYSNYTLRNTSVSFPAPSNLSFTKIDLGTIRLNWTDNSTGEEGFKIDKKIGTNEWVIGFANVEPNTTLWSDANAEINQTIQYRVYGYKGNNSSATAQTPDIDNTFPAPTNIAITPTGLTSVTLTWNDNSIGEDKFEIERKISTDASYVKIAEVAGSNTSTKSWTDASLAMNITYDYRVKAVKGTYSSAYISRSHNNAFPAPSNLTIVQNNVHTFTLNWTDNSVGEDGFRIERKIDSGEFVVLNTTTGTTYVDDSVSKQSYTTVYYRVCAFIGPNSSDYASNSSSINFPAPSNLTFTKENISTIRLNWQDNSTGEDGFKIDKKIGTGEWTIGFASLGSNTTTWTDTSAEINQNIQYRVYAFKGNNNSGSLATTTIDNVFPAPTSLSVSQLNITSLTLAWNDNSKGEEKFEIERKLSADANYVKIQEIPGSDTATKTWTDYTAEPNSTYDYRVKAVKGTNSSAFSAQTFVNTFPAPSNLTATQNNVHTFTLNWTDNSTGEDGFKIERKIDGGTFTEIATVEANAVTYTDDTVSKKGYGTVYYQIRAYKGTYHSAYTSHSSLVSFPPPTSLTFSKDSVSTIRLNWQDNSSGEDGFKIDKKIGTGEWAIGFATVGENITTWSDISAEINQNLQYRVYAYKGINTTATLATPAIDNTFPAPSNLTATQTSITTANLTWNDNSIGEEKFEIERKLPADANYVKITEVTGGDGATKSWNDTTVEPGLTYDYRVRAVKGTDNSAYISRTGYYNEFQSPSDLSVTQDNVHTFTLNWTDNSTGEDGFKIERKIDGGTFTEIATVVANTVTYTDDTVSKKGYGTVYYQIRAYKGTYHSAYTSHSSLVSFPPPTSLTFSKDSVNTIRLNWQDNSSGEDGFKIDKKIGTGEWTIGFATVGENITTWSDISAEINQNLQYRVYAYKGINTSANLSTPTIDNTFPAPTNFTVTQTSITTANLTWNDNSIGEEKFEIERKLPADANYVKITEVTGGDGATKSWNDTTVEPGLTYDYQVRAVKGTDTSAYIARTGYYNEFQPPSDLSVTQDNVHTFTLNWLDNSTGEDGFKIERKIDGGTFTEIATVTGTTYTDATVAKTSFETIYYQVKAYKGTYHSEYASNQAAVNFPAPSDIIITHTSLTSATLSWSDNSLGEDKFEIERKISADIEFVKIGEVIGSDTSTKSFDDTTLEVSQTYDYRVKAVKGINYSEYFEKNGYESLPPPSNLVLVIVDGNSFQLDWTDNSIGEDGFTIDRKVGSNGTWVSGYATVAAENVTWSDTSVIIGLTYFYRVSANYNTFSSKYSSEVSGFISDIMFSLIPAGSFQMGQDGIAIPVHTVNLTKSFFLGRYELTQSEWELYMPLNTSSTYGLGDDYPVYLCSWYEILVYCNLRSIAEGLTPCYTINNSKNPNDWGAIPTSSNAVWEAVICDFDENGYRLPTESEWEYATRYNDGRSYPWGNTEPTTSMCNYDNSKSEIVGSYGSNSKLGLRDAAGNVFEWVWDLYADYTSDNITDPIGPSSGTSRVFRGGSWNSLYSYQLNCARRKSSNPYSIMANVGFRVARTK